jgi:hypothetical protein
MSIVDDDERGSRRGQHLRLVLHSNGSLRHGHRDLTRHVRPKHRLPRHPVCRRHLEERLRVPRRDREEEGRNQRRKAAGTERPAAPSEDEE